MGVIHLLGTKVFFCCLFLHHAAVYIRFGLTADSTLSKCVFPHRQGGLAPELITHQLLCTQTSEREEQERLSTHSGSRKAVDNDAGFLFIITLSQRIPQIHCHILLQRRACSGGAPSRRISGEQANKGRNMGAKVIIGTKVTGWRDCEEMICTISSLASLQTLLVKISPNTLMGAL